MMKTPGELKRRRWLLLVPLLLGGVLYSLASAAQTPQLKLRFGFDEGSGTTSASDPVGSIVGAKLQFLDYNGRPAELFGARGSGVTGAKDGNPALKFASPFGQGTNGPVAALTNASLAFGELRAFTATIWFKARSRQPGNIGPRLFLLGTADAANDTGATNSIGLKFQTAGCLHFQLNNITAEADFVWSLPTNVWTFVAMVYDGTKVVVYHGTESNPVELITAKPAPAQVVRFRNEGALFVGNRHDRARSFDGWIDDFRFYTGAADPEFIESIRQSVAGIPTPAVSSATDRTAQWVLVTAPAFLKTLQPLIERRRIEGLNVTVVETAKVLTEQQVRDGHAEPLKQILVNIFRGKEGPKHLLLAGTAALNGNEPQFCVPMPLGTTARMKGQPTDCGYALPDGAGRPTVAVGRFPARSVAEMEGMVRKTLNLERVPASGPWRSGLLLVQGNPGGGPLAEMFVDAIARPRINRLHSAWEFKAISHNGGSVFFAPGAGLQPLATEYMREGQLFSVYLGHSSSSGLWSNGTNFLSADEWSRLDIHQQPGVFFTCGCFACEPDRGKEQAYGLAAMRNPNGPAAVIGAYGESFAAPGLLAADGLLRCCTEPPFPSRLADYWLAVQRGLAEGEIDEFTFNLMDMSDGTQRKVPLSVQRTEHLEMWTLLGDPALRLPVVPLGISLIVKDGITPGKRLRLEGVLPEEFKGAKVQVGLERPAGTRPIGLNQASAKNEADRNDLAVQNNRRINQRTLAAENATADGRTFSCSINAPEKLDSPLVIVRAYAESGNRAVQGVLKLPVKSAE